VPVEKNLLPHDPQGQVQAVAVAQGPGGAIYVKQRTLWCKSEDGGRNWIDYHCDETVERSAGFFTILNDGTFVGIPNLASGQRTNPVEIYGSEDEGRSWKKLSEIPQPQKYHHRYVYGLLRLPDGTLLCRIQFGDLKTAEPGNKWVSGSDVLFVYRSTDNGESWEGPVKICESGSEGGIARMTSGKLLAAIRFQRPSLPSDPPDLIQRQGHWYKEAFGKFPPYPYKHIFLADSDDEGRSWQNVRQLTTAFGQCYGFPAGLSDGTAVVVHENRYPREISSGRAVISGDEGKTWNDEVYYLYYGLGTSGYNQSIVLKDDVILTVAGTSDSLDARSWQDWVGKCDAWAIHWKLS
jgi:hypothetical protein